MKIISKLYRFVILLLSEICHSIISLSSWFLSYEIYLIRSGRIGHLALNTEWFLRKRMSADGSDVFTIIVSPKLIKSNYVSNIYLLGEYLRVLKKEKNVLVISSTILHRLLHNKRINSKDRKNYYLPSDHEMNNDFSKLPKVLNLSEEHIKKGIHILKKLGVKDTQRIVTIFARDSAYLSRKFPDKDWSYHDYRNANIDTYIKSIDYLIQKGYTVIRIGSTVSKKVNYNHEKFIDYPFTNFRSDFLDIIIVYLSEFVIGTTSGATDTALVLDIPFLGVNYAPFTESPLGKYDQYIQKKLQDIKSNKVKKFKDFIGKDLSKTYNSHEFSNQYNTSYIDNTEDEILDAVVEFEDRIKNLESIDESNCTDLLNEYEQKYWSKMPNNLIDPKISCSWLKKYSDLYI